MASEGSAFAASSPLPQLSQTRDEPEDGVAEADALPADSPPSPASPCSPSRRRGSQHDSQEGSAVLGSAELEGPEATVIEENSDIDMFNFLTDESRNPDLSDPLVRKIGHMRSDSTTSKRRDLANSKRSKIMCLQSVVGLIIFSRPVQLLVFIIVVFDMVLTGIALGDSLEDDHPVFIIGDYTIVVILAVDVVCRWFAQGAAFVCPPRNCKMNIFEAILVPITILEVSVLKDMDLPLPLLRALRPVLRAVRLMRVLIRTAGKGKQYLRRLRHQVSGDRMRFTQEGYDLDLQYVTAQILVMSDPAVGREAILRNPLKEVACFLNERHPNKYLVLNTSEVRRYPLAPVFKRYYHFPITQDSVPTLEGLKALVKALDAWLKADDHNLLAVSSKHNQGRVALVVIALLLYRKDYRSATSALAAFEHHRKRKEGNDMENIQTLDSASQVRFLEYFAHMCTLPKGLRVRPARISRIQLSGLPNVKSLDISCFRHPNSTTVGAAALRPSPSGLRPPSKEFNASKSLYDLSAGEDDLDVFTEEPSSLLQKVQNVIEEGAMDSRRSGAAPLTGQPVFSSKQDAMDKKVVSAKTIEEKDTGVVVAKVWEVKDVEISGEMAFEFHLQGGSPGGENAITGDRKSSCSGWRCCPCRRRASDGAGRKFADGMLFGCWLHSALLEHNEVPDKRPTRGKKGIRLEISLDRFALDKAANAPSLRSLSSAMKLDIDFVVDERVTLQDLDNDPPELHLVASNVNMSEWETLNWLTWVSEKVWPKFRKGFTKIVTDSVEDARQSLPGPLRNLRLVQCSFGDAYPRFGPVCASSAAKEEVQLDIGLAYSTETSIVLEVGYLAFGINHLKIGGMLSLKFTPLLEEVPVFSAMQLFFLNSPEIELRFTNVLEVANTSFLMDKIRSVINQALNNRLVVPNVLNINWGDPNNDDTLTWTSIMPVCVIRVAVHRARELRSSSSVLVRNPDAHVRLTVGDQHLRSSTVPGRDPVWGASATFDCVVYDARQHVDIKVFDTDFTGRNWVIGKINKVPVAQVVDKGQGHGVWMQLHATPARAKSEIFVLATVFNLEANPSKMLQYVDARTFEEPQDNHVSLEMDGVVPNAEEEAGDEEGHGADEDEEEEESEVELGDEDDHDQEGELRANSVGLLVCTIEGGQMPDEVGKPSEVDVKATFGEAISCQHCQEPEEGSEGALSKKTFKAIEFLNARGSSPEEIASLLDEQVADVTRAIRRITCNFRAQQKLCLLLQPNDFRDPSIHFAVQTAAKKKVLASGKVEMAKLFESGGKWGGQVDCAVGRKGGSVVKLHVEMRLFSLERSEPQSAAAARREDDQPPPPLENPRGSGRASTCGIDDGTATSTTVTERRRSGSKMSRSASKGWRAPVKSQA